MKTKLLFIAITGKIFLLHMHGLISKGACNLDVMVIIMRKRDGIYTCLYTAAHISQ